jgi:hypothetical protein
MAFEGFSSTPLRRPGPRASSLAPASGLAWAAGHLYSAADTGAIKCACLHRDTLFLSTRKGIWRVDCSTGRCVCAQTQPNRTCAPVVLPHHVTNTAGSNSNYNRLPLTHFTCMAARYEAFMGPDAAVPLAHAMAVVQATNSASPLLWACGGSGAAVLYGIEDDTSVQKVGQLDCNLATPQYWCSTHPTTLQGGTQRTPALTPLLHPPPPGMLLSRRLFQRMWVKCWDCKPHLSVPMLHTHSWLAVAQISRQVTVHCAVHLGKFEKHNSLEPDQP